MLQKLQKKAKEQKGFTLIELLAVIVILGIIAAIAVPSILGIINNTKKDAHIANAQQIVNSAKIYIADTKTNITTTATPIDLATLITNGYIETIKDPSGKGYDTSTTKVYATLVKTTGEPDKTVYTVTLESIVPTDGTATVYIGGDGAAANAIDISTLARTNVTLP